MNKYFLTLIFFAGSISVQAQTEQHKIVFDLNNKDTAIHNTVLRQFNNVLKEAPGTELELVCHGQAIYMFVKDKLFFAEQIKELKSKGKVRFKVCANALRRYNVDQTLITELAEIVPTAIIELSTRQKQGWSYIKAGD